MRIAKPFHTVVFPGVIIAFLALIPTAPAQSSYTFTKVLDTATQRTDGQGLFNINTTTTPAYDGQWVVFRDLGSADDGSLQAIWSFDTKTAKFTKLVDVHNLGGTAFTELHLMDTAPTVRNGTVIFLGRSFTTKFLEGLYSVPVTGGTVTAVADYRTADPSGGTFTAFDSGAKQLGAFGFDGSTVVFQGTGNPGTRGVYVAKPDGTSLSLAADNLHPFVAATGNVLLFTAPAVGGGNVVMSGTDATDPATGYNGLYVAKAGNNGVLTELVNSKQQLPGGTNAAFHTRFDAPYLAFDGTIAAFHADDAAAPAGSPRFGLYWTDLTSHAIHTIADMNSTLPGLGKLKNIGDLGVSASQGNVLFMAADTTTKAPGNNALYLWANGTAARIVGTGDVIDGRTVQVVHDPGPGALYGAGFAFLVEFGAPNSFAVYYATTVVSINAASQAPGAPLAAGAIASAYGPGLADTAAAAATFPLLFTLANVTLSVKDSAGVTRPASLYYAGPTQINYVVPDGTAIGAGTVTVAKSGQTVATGAIQIAAVAPGLFTANSDGKGAAAANAETVTASDARTFQPTIACDATGRNCVTAPIDLGAATDQVFLELYGTGIRGKTSLTATIGGVNAIPAFGVSPTYPGMDQVNLLIDRSLIGRGEVDVVLTVDGVAANTVKTNVK